MFKCQISGRISEPGEKSFKIVTKTRPKTYVSERTQGERKVRVTTQGFETVQELTVCEAVYNKVINESNRK